MPIIDHIKEATLIPKSAQNDPGFFSSQIARAQRFTLDLNPSPKSTLSIACGGCEHCAPDYCVDRTSFDFFSIEFVAGGYGDVILEGKKYAIGPGDVFTYGPKIKHTILSDKDHPLIKYFLDFRGKMARSLLKQCKLSPGTVVQTSSPEHVLQSMEQMIETASRRGRNCQRMCSLILEQMLLRINECAVPPGSIGTRAFATFQTCRKVIEDNYLQMNTLSDIAGECGIDGAYLCRLFQRFDRQSPYQYLTSLKMSAAARMLQQPDMMVKQVSTQMGFTDQFHFSRTFKRVHGTSPAHFSKLQNSRQNKS